MPHNKYPNRPSNSDKAQEPAASSTSSVFNPIQLHLLEMFNYCPTEQSMLELKKVLANYYASEVQKEADRLWDEGSLNGEAIERILKEHWTMSDKS